ncbi:ArsR/SmtB family transcription factor [Alkalicoccus saliphilus]|uniref:Transcriptional regulator n=1 Tax=Alkalicoccus saliphilus TaxID=200989 RepID=A0A2T4U521_9BACI|nr:metalloregulator ArsR/SmtB family transcription factor [Alkalicoccus saliphilus]PTL38500.1 transcriptional regulator [Alkalicoccus saliphilus]
MEKILSALAEPKRTAIIELLRDGPMTVGEIADKLRIPQPQASKHLRVLYEAGLVKIYPMANRRIYELEPDGLQKLDDWLETFRELWEQRLDRLESYLKEEEGRNT